MSTSEDSLSMKEVAQQALQANKDHQYALKVYTERLEAELKTIDKLLNTADFDDDDDEPELDAGGTVHIPNSSKAIFPFPSHEFLLEDSPFREDADKRNRYFNYTAAHPMKAKELEVLAESVRTENHRKRALEAQKGGLPTFATHDDKARDFLEWNTDGIDWDRVAEKVSSVAGTPRTAHDCAIRWLGGKHPQFVHSQWTDPELEKLQGHVKDAPNGRVDWVQVASNLGTNRTPLDCMRHGVIRRQMMWTPETDNALLRAVNKYGTDNWVLVARHVSEDAFPQQCQQRFVRTLDPTIQHGLWTEDEDAKLRSAVAVYGNSWTEVAEVIQGRTNEQCRDHWSDKLNPNVAKGRWTNDEDRRLLEAVESVGEGNWKAVCEWLGTSRTDGICRGRYDTLMKKKAKGKGKASDPQVPTVLVTGQPSSTRNSTNASGFATDPEPGASSITPDHPRARKRHGTSSSKPCGIPGDVEPISEKQRPRPKPRPRAKQSIGAEAQFSEATSQEQPALGSSNPHLSPIVFKKDHRQGTRKRKAATVDGAGLNPKRRRHNKEQQELSMESLESSSRNHEHTEPAAGGMVSQDMENSRDAHGAEESTPPGFTDSSPSAPQPATITGSTANKDIPTSSGVPGSRAGNGRNTRRTIGTEPTRRQPARITSRKP